MKVKKRTRLLLLLIIVILLVACSLLFVYQNYIGISNFKTKDEASNIKEAKGKLDNVVGWLRVEGTNIDLPLLARENELDISVSDENFAWTNSFPDEKSNHFTYISHNVRNVSSNPIVGDNTMTYFEQLMSFIYPDFIKDNQFIEFTDPSGETSIYRIYGVSLIDESQSLSFYDTFSKDELDDYIKKAKDESMYNINVNVDSNDMLLTLYTCTRFYGGGGTYSFRVDARKLREGEKMKYSTVETNKNYKKIEEKMEEGDVNEEV